MARNLYGGVVIAYHHNGCRVARNGDVMAQLVIDAIVAVEMLKTKALEPDTTYSPTRDTFTRARSSTLAQEAISLMKLDTQIRCARW